MIRSLHMIDSLATSHGGPSRTVPQLCQALSQAGHPAEILTNSYAATLQGSRLATSAEVPVREVVGPLGASRIWGYNPKLAREFESETLPDLIHVHGQWLHVNHLAARLARKHNLPLVISPRGMLEPWCLQHRWFRKKAMWLCWARRDLHAAGLLHATSPGEADSLRALAPSSTISVIPNGVEDLQALAGADRLADQWRERFENRRILLFLSRLHPKKGLEDLLQAWRILQPEKSGWHLLVAGEGSPQYTASLAAGQGVTFLGQIEGDEKAGLLQAASLFVLPTRSENFGLVVAEALSAGTPVLTTPESSWAQLEDFGGGWLWERSREGLDQTLGRLLNTSDKTLKQRGEQGRQYVLANLDWPGIGRRLSEAYARLLRHRL